MQSDVSRSVRGTAAILSQQFLSRLLSFALNVFLVRISSLETLGFLSDLQLLHASLLLVARESIRMALLRTKHSQLSSNFSAVPFLIVTSIAPIVYLLKPELSPLKLSCFSIYYTAAAIELLAEPLYIYCQTELLYTIRVRAESQAFILQSSTTLIASLLTIHQGTVPVETAVLIHSYAQVIYSIVLLSSYSTLLKTHLNLSFPNLIVKFLPRQETVKDKRYSHN